MNTSVNRAGNKPSHASRACRVIFAMAVAAVSSGCFAQGGGSQSSYEDTRHFAGERFLTRDGTRIYAQPSSLSQIVRDVPRMHVVYATPTSVPGWLAVTGVAAEQFPNDRQGVLEPVGVKDNRLRLRLKRIDRNVYWPAAGYVIASKLASLDASVRLPDALKSRRIPIPSPLEEIGVPERRFVPKNPLETPYRSVVRILIGPDEKMPWVCSGFVVGRPGVVASAGHCFDDEHRGKPIFIEFPVLQDGRPITVRVPGKLLRYMQEITDEAHVDWALLEVSDARFQDILPLQLASLGSWLSSGAVEVMTVGFSGDLVVPVFDLSRRTDIPHADTCMLYGGQVFMRPVSAPPRGFGIISASMDCITGPGDSGGPMLIWNDISSRLEVIGIAATSHRIEKQENALSPEARDLVDRTWKKQAAKLSHPVAWGVNEDWSEQPGSASLRHFLDLNSQTYRHIHKWLFDERFYDEVFRLSHDVGRFDALWNALAESVMTTLPDSSTTIVNHTWHLNDFRMARLLLDVPLPIGQRQQSPRTYGDALVTKAERDSGVEVTYFRLGKFLDLGQLLVPEKDFDSYAEKLQPQIDALMREQPVLKRSLPNILGENNGHWVVEVGEDLFVVDSKSRRITEVIRHWMNLYDGDLDLVRMQNYLRSSETEVSSPIEVDPTAPPMTASFRAAPLNGRVPSRIQGVGTVTTSAVWQAVLAAQAKDSSQRPLVLSALPLSHGVPSALNVQFAASGSGFADMQQRRLLDVLKANGVDSKRRIIVYGDGADSWDSHNVVLRLKAAGFTDVAWMRAGIEGWVAGGLPLSRVTATDPR